MRVLPVGAGTPCAEPGTPPPEAGDAWVSEFSNNMAADRGEVWTGNLSENLDLMIEEMKIAQKDGITAIVDCGPPLHWTQRPEYLRQLSKLSGMPIIIGGGYHTGPRYPAEITRMSEEEIVERIWGVEYHPLHHDAALFTNVMRLRRLLGPGGPDILRVGEGGYLLVPPHDFLFIERLPV